jgi:ADP-ribose pyrophosphatase YjhB (NUDIX family)
MKTNEIRVIAVCVFRHDDKILVCEYFDQGRDTPFYRLLGGAVEFGETTQQSIKREIKEEIDKAIANLKLLTILENIFTLEGETGHEIVYIYEGHFADEAAYQRESFVVHEEGETLKASWQPLSFFNDYHRLVPEALVPLLTIKT